LNGGSMSPLLLDGDELLVDPTRGAPRLGDVIVFPQGEILVAHRVIQMGRELRTAGDASRGQCERVDPGTILGIVTEVRRRGYVIHSAVKSPVKALFLRARLALQYHFRLHR
jgi:signal peptidase I